MASREGRAWGDPDSQAKVVYASLGCDRARDRWKDANRPTPLLPGVLELYTGCQDR